MILERLGLDSSLTGDLLEEYARGRSTLWYWRQLLIAIWTGVWQTIFGHKVLAVRALATGCALNAIWLFLWSEFLTVGFPTRPELSFSEIASLSILLFTQVITGWVVARTHRPHAVPMVMLFACWLAAWYVADTLRPGPPAYVTWLLAPISVEIVGLLSGALLGARPIRRSPSATQPSS